jgi:hypothetical protein
MPQDSYRLRSNDEELTMAGKDLSEKLDNLRDELASGITPETIKDLENVTIREVREFAMKDGEKGGTGEKPASIFTVVILTFAAR